MIHPSVALRLRLDRITEGLLLGLILFVPWPFGSVYAWSEEVIVCVAAALALIFFAKLLLIPRADLFASWFYLPIGLFLAMAFCQMVPLPHAVLGFISPHTLETKSRLLADLPAAAAAPMSLSFYTDATRHDLRMVLACAMIFVVSVNLLHTRHRIRRALWTIVICGGAVIVLALLQDLTGAARVYWTFIKPIEVALGGPFIGHNDFPLFANMTIGSAIALLMYRLTEHTKERTKVRTRGGVYQRSLQNSLLDLGLAVVILLGVFAVLLSLSRSGLLAMLAAFVVVGVVIGVVWRVKAERWMIGICVVAIILASLTFASNTFASRLGTLKHTDTEFKDRLQILKDILAQWPTFPIFGTGLGTHEVVYPMFERLLGTANFDHAENEYAQMLEETGALGVAIIAGFVALLVATFARAVRRSRETSIGIACFGLGIAVFAVLAQSGFGFGMHVPANAVLFSVTCALLINVARIPANRHGPSPAIEGDPEELPASSLTTTMIWRWAAVLGLTALFIPALLYADRARRGEAEWWPARIAIEYLPNPYFTGSADYRREVALAAQSAHYADPENVKYFYWDALCTWDSLQSEHDPSVDQDVRTPQEKEQIGRILRQYDEIRALAPTYAPAILQSGELRYLVLDQPRGLDEIRLAASIHPTDPVTLGILASIQCDLGDFDSALATYRHYLSLNGIVEGSFSTVADKLVTDSKRPDLALRLAGDDPGRQLEVANKLREVPDRPDFLKLAKEIEGKARQTREQQLLVRCADPQASAQDLGDLGKLEVSEHDLNDAIECFRRALVRDYGNIDLHVALAQALLASGRKQDALDEARTCLRLKPDTQAAQQVITDVGSIESTTQPTTDQP